MSICRLPSTALPAAHQQHPIPTDGDAGPSGNPGHGQRRIAKGNWASQAVRKAIEEMMAAVIAAITAAAAVTTITSAG
jgi:hypothetical protein